MTRIIKTEERRSIAAALRTRAIAVRSAAAETNPIIVAPAGMRDQMIEQAHELDRLATEIEDQRFRLVLERIP